MWLGSIYFGKVLNARLRGCTKGGVMDEQGGLGERGRIEINCLARGKLWGKQLKEKKRGICSIH